MTNQTLAGLIGSVDNSNEATPPLNKKPTILGLIITVEVLAWTCGLLRLWTRVKIVKSLGWDDFFMAFAMLVTTLASVLVCVGAYHFGLGKHFTEIGGSEGMRNYLKGLYIANASYVIATTSIKLSLLLQYFRVLERGTALYRICIGLIGVVTAWGIAYIILALFPCAPVSAFWALKADVNCWGFASQNPNLTAATFTSHTLLNTILDVLILILPVPLFFRKGISNKTKRGVIGLGILGILVVIVAICRAHDIIHTRAATSPTFDPSWYGCTSVVLSGLEVDLAVMCASIPVFWPYLQSAGFHIFVTREVHVLSESRTSLRGYDEASGIELQLSGPPGAGPGVGNTTTVGHDSGHLEKFEKFDPLMTNESDETLRKVSSGHSRFSKKLSDSYMDESAIEYADSTRSGNRLSTRSPGPGFHPTISPPPPSAKPKER